jgi:phenylacetate-coenzyme A ligase PaaK-like adenylate-forming protein
MAAKAAEGFIISKLNKVDQNIKLILDGRFECINAENFNDIALAVFRHQYANNDLYRSFTNSLHIQPESVDELNKIPFLPVSFFKTHKVSTGVWKEASFVFASSGTTGDIPARHYVYDDKLYEASLLYGFRKFYGDPEDYVILALLPSYLERKNASLAYMAKVLMERSTKTESGFYLDEWEQLQNLLLKLESAGQKTLLLGVTFALLDFAGAYPMRLEHTIVMETGGMKGRREEWTRKQVHEFLAKQWGLGGIHSEYGMTELLSQAYAKKDGIFTCSPTMKMLCRDINDPLELSETGTGCLNIIDVANIYSCSFIATDDIGNIAKDGTFEVLGRVDHSALRGCSLMVV